MAININSANTQAGRLGNCAGQLREAKTVLLAYKSSISLNWQGKEVSSISLGIDQTVAQIDNAINQMESLGSDIKNTAAAIKRDDDAAAAAKKRADEAAAAAKKQANAAAAAAASANQEKQSRINAAQHAYDSSRSEFNALTKDKEKLEARYKKASFPTRIVLYPQLQELNDKVTAAEKACDICRRALNAAKK